jgi:hypothetical protein
VHIPEIAMVEDIIIDGMTIRTLHMIETAPQEGMDVLIDAIQVITCQKAQAEAGVDMVHDAVIEDVIVGLIHEIDIVPASIDL